MRVRRLYEEMAYGPVPVQECYWNATISHQPVFPILQGSADCDVAIIGGGYTGLTAALDLAEAGADVALLEAESPGWGASGRNGGFCCLGGARLSPEALARKFGSEEARAFADAQRAAVDLVDVTLDRLDIDADRHSKGETILAHRASEIAPLKRSAAEARAGHGVECAFLDRQALADSGMNSPEFHAGLMIPIGFALNPLKYALGLAAAAAGAGVRIFAQSPARAVRQAGRGWQIDTPEGALRARKLLVATNGYSSEDIPGWLAGRYLPVQSNILVTRVLTAEELAAQGWTSRQMSYDTRHLLHYFRLMPDNRMLFGQRGALRATPAAQAAMRAQARSDFERIFPHWRHVETPHFWSGLAALSRSLTPYVGPMDGVAGGFVALCYHGNGVAMGGYAGGILADLALGRPARRIYPAVMRRPMRRFPLGRFRRAVLPVAYRWYQYQDDRA